MKVVVFTNAYEPIVSGVVTAIRFFRQGLMENGDEVVIFAPDHKDIVNYKQEKAEQIYRFSAVNLSRQVYFPIAVPCYPGLMSLLRRINPDVIHSHHPFVLGRVGLRAARCLRVPMVYTFHTQYEQYSHYFPLPQNLVKWAGRNAVKDFAQSADLLTTPAESSRELLISYGITKEIRVLPNPLDLSPYQKADGREVRRRFNLGNKKLLIFVGRIGKEKNLDLLLRSFAKLVGEFGDELRLMLVGSGAALGMLKQLAMDLNLTEQVIFTGMVDYQEIPHFYAAADIFVMTSTSEVKPLVFIEAMAAGLPVVAVEAFGSKDTFTSGYNGLLTPEDASAFAGAVGELLRNETRRREMARAAKETATRYSVENLTQELLALYQEAIDRKKGGCAIEKA